MKNPPQYQPPPLPDEVIDVGDLRFGLFSGRPDIVYVTICSQVFTLAVPIDGLVEALDKVKGFKMDKNPNKDRNPNKETIKPKLSNSSKSLTETITNKMGTDSPSNEIKDLQMNGLPLVEHTPITDEDLPSGVYYPTKPLFTANGKMGAELKKQGWVEVDDSVQDSDDKEYWETPDYWDDRTGKR
jgi:hypothetical protein